MTSRGTSFAVSPERLAELLGCTDDDSRLEWLEELEEADGVDRLDFDKDWAELHRALGNDELVIPEDGPPAAFAVLGSQPLIEDDETDWFAGLIPPDEVADVARGLAGVDEALLRGRLLDLTGQDADITGATVETFRRLRAFLARTAEAGHGVVFSLPE